MCAACSELLAVLVPLLLSYRLRVCSVDSSLAGSSICSRLVETYVSSAACLKRDQGGKNKYIGVFIPGSDIMSLARKVMVRTPLLFAEHSTELEQSDEIMSWTSSTRSRSTSESFGEHPTHCTLYTNGRKDTSSLPLPRRQRLATA